MDDRTLAAEQAHLDDIYAQLVRLRDELTERLETTHRQAARDLIDMSEEVRQDFGGADEAMETLAAIETLNSVIDSYNQVHDFDIERLGRVAILLRQPYFAKVRLRMRPGRPARDVYIGAAGMTDDHHTPLVVDWRNPIAETYYNQEMGTTSYEVDGRLRTVELELRRQFDITRDHLNLYFDSDVAIEDSLLLSALSRHHSEKLQAITATIQREQNRVIRHRDVGALIVSGIAGSGKTSVLLQRIAFLLYRERKTLDASQVYLFTPNDVFRRYVDTVLPSLGESNPRTFTWRSFTAAQGLADHGEGGGTTADELGRLKAAVPSLELLPSDFREVKVADTVLLRTSSIQGAAEKYAHFPVGPKFVALVKDELHGRLNRRIANLAHDEELQERMLALDVDEQMARFGEVISPNDEDELLSWAKRYAEGLYGGAHDEIERSGWLRIDRIGARILGTSNLNSVEWLYLHLLITGGGGRDARYVMVDEVQDYSAGQLMVLARYFSRAHFLLLGDEHQAIREGSASFDEIRRVFEESHGEVEECRLLTSYRSTPEVTALFWGLVEQDEHAAVSSVQRDGGRPRIIEVSSGDAGAYLAMLREILDEAGRCKGLCAVICADRARSRWLARQLKGIRPEGAPDGQRGGLRPRMGDAQPGSAVTLVDKGDALPAGGVVLMELSLAKGLEFDHVVVADAQAEVYPDTPLSRNRLYTALSRATHRVSVLSQGPLTPLLAATERC